MSIIEESIKKQDNILSNQIKKELNLLPKILRQKKIEINTASKEMVLLKEKSINLHKELEQLILNITSLEKELTSIIIKNDSIKSNQKIILNSINNEMPFDLNQYLKNNNKLKELMLIFLHYENDYSKELSLILDNNNELTSLLIGSYSYLKILNSDFPEKYNQIKDTINKKLIEVKELDNNNLFCLIINYIENIFKLLDNKEKINLNEHKIEESNQKKNEIFVKLKIYEEKKKEKENYSNIINNYINELISLIEKYKLLMRCSNTKLINSLREKKSKKIGNYSGAKLNISCPNNSLSQKDNEIRKTNNKISYINIDLTSIEKNNKNNKKTIDSVDDDSKINKSNSNFKRSIISNYNNVKDLEKDIFDQFEQLKNNPLYSIKINNNNVNIILNKKNNKISKNKILKKHNTKNIDTTKKKNLLKKNSKKQIIDNNNDNNIVINQTNTTMTYNNIIINNNNNEINKFNLSYDSNKKNSNIKDKKSSNYIKKNSPFKKDEKIIRESQIHKPGKMKLIPYLTQDYQLNKDNQRKSNESYIRRKTNNKESNNYLKEKSPLYSPHITKNVININNPNYKNISPNIDNVNCNTDQMGDKVNQSSYSKVSQKNIYISIKHNKTNLCKDKLNDKNNSNKRNEKSVNKTNVNYTKKDRNVNYSKIEKKKSPNKQSSSFLLNILNSEEYSNKNYLNEKPKNKKITKININIDKCKNKSPILKQRQYYDKKIKDIEQNDKDKEIIGNEINNKNKDNSLKKNINKNCNIIPFKKNKTNKTYVNPALDKKNNNNSTKNNKTPKANTNYKNEKNIEINNSEIKNNNNSQIVSNLIQKEISNYSFNKQDYKSHKKSYFKI